MKHKYQRWNATKNRCSAAFNRSISNDTITTQSIRIWTICEPKTSQNFRS